jgi:hypothetical protein
MVSPPEEVLESCIRRQQAGNLHSMSHFTKSLLDVLEETDGEVKNVDLIERVNLIFEKNNLTQRAGLYCDGEQADHFFKANPLN